MGWNLKNLSRFVCLLLGISIVRADSASLAKKNGSDFSAVPLSGKIRASFVRLSVAGKAALGVAVCGLTCLLCRKKPQVLPVGSTGNGSGIEISGQKLSDLLPDPKRQLPEEEQKKFIDLFDTNPAEVVPAIERYSAQYSADALWARGAFGYLLDKEKRQADLPNRILLATSLVTCGLDPNKPYVSNGQQPVDMLSVVIDLAVTVAQSGESCALHDPLTTLIQTILEKMDAELLQSKKTDLIKKLLEIPRSAQAIDIPLIRAMTKSLKVRPQDSIQYLFLVLDSLCDNRSADAYKESVAWANDLIASSDATFIATIVDSAAKDVDQMENPFDLPSCPTFSPVFTVRNIIERLDEKVDGVAQLKKAVGVKKS